MPAHSLLTCTACDMFAVLNAYSKCRWGHTLAVLALTAPRPEGNNKSVAGIFKHQGNQRMVLRFITIQLPLTHPRDAQTMMAD